MESDLFSIVIPTYNSIEYSAECVASALGQTYAHVEVIVDDNASSDGTGEMLRHRFGHDPRFRLFERKEDLNMPLGWSRGMSESRGAYQMLLHSDNLLHPKYCQKILTQMKKFEAMVAYSDCLYFEGATPRDLFEGPEYLKTPVDMFAPGAMAVATMFRFQRMIPISVVTFKTDALEGKPAFDAAFEWDPDMALLVRMAKKWGILHVREGLGAMRTHPLQAPNWKAKSYRVQYERLLDLQHREGQTEPFHYLIHRASSHEDICQRISQLEIKFFPFLGFLARWVAAETQVAVFFLRAYLRKIKRVFFVAFHWVSQRSEVKQREANKRARRATSTPAIS